MSYIHSALVKDLYQYPIGFVVPYNCSRNKAYSTGTSHASASSVVCPEESGSVRTGGYISAFLSKSMDYLLFIVEKSEFYWLGLLAVLVFKGAARHAKIGTNHWETLHNPKKDRSFVILVGTCNSLIASVECDTISRRRGRITCPK